MYIETKFDNCCSDFSEIYSAIDSKLADIAERLLNNIRFGFDSKIDYIKYEDLILYRTIFEKLLYCSDSLCNVNINMVVSKIRNLTNSIC